ncbi:hypothetical protein TNCV_4009001 [Trichonephila clavipes]|nr:hypothetical protein TNCV_4009001 [Trichonephila clavipes]
MRENDYERLITENNSDSESETPVNVSGSNESLSEFPCVVDRMDQPLTNCPLDKHYNRSIFRIGTKDVSKHVTYCAFKTLCRHWCFFTSKGLNRLTDVDKLFNFWYTDHYEDCLKRLSNVARGCNDGTKEQYDTKRQKDIISDKFTFLGKVLAAPICYGRI